MYEIYVPAPVSTEEIKLPRRLRKLIEPLAQNLHEVWAEEKIAAGWRYGPQRDDIKKLNNCLVSYEDLSEEEKQYDRNNAIETLRLIHKLGFKIKK